MHLKWASYYMTNNRTHSSLFTFIQIELFQCALVPLQAIFEKIQFILVHLKDRYIIRVYFANTIFLFVHFGCAGVDVLRFHLLTKLFDAIA